MLHDECGKVVHRPCSSCISSVQNLIETPSSSSYQLGLEVWLSYLRLSCYKQEFRDDKGNDLGFNICIAPWSPIASDDWFWRQGDVVR